MTLLINDNGPNVTSTFKEAWATGWESVATIAAPVGTGAGQFPLPAQILTTGHVVIRKSATADSTTGRSWLIYADAYTFYLFVHSEAETDYSPFIFGDVFSMVGKTDAYRCIIIGQSGENSIPSYTLAYQDQFSTAPANAAFPVGLPAHFMPRGAGGGGQSITICKYSSPFCASFNNQYFFSGVLATPNGSDNSFYFEPIYIIEPVTAILRGRLRGCYLVCHSATNFSDGQTVQGANDTAGKTFQIIKTTNGAAGGTTSAPMWCLEISPTLEAN